MRVSTTQIYTQGVEAFQQQQVKLAKLQQQISTGVKITKPSDDPAASSRILQMEQTISLNLQYQVNIDLAQARLEVEETSMASVENLVFRLRELVIQGNNGSLDTNGQQALSQEIDERLGELLALANTRDNNGDYLFAGYQSMNQPFTRCRPVRLPTWSTTATRASVRCKSAKPARWRSTTLVTTSFCSCKAIRR